VTINGIMASHGIKPDTDIHIAENAVLLFRAWETFTNERTRHWLATKEWLPSYFEKECHKFFGSRYTEEEICDAWRSSADFSDLDEAEEKARAYYDAMSDEDKAETDEMLRDLWEFVEGKLRERDADNEVLAQLAKEFE